MWTDAENLLDPMQPPAARKRRGKDNEREPPPSKRLAKDACRMSWEPYQLLARMFKLEQRVAKIIVTMFEDDYTVPFMCRYRSDTIGDMKPDELRKVRSAYDGLVTVQLRAAAIKRNLLSMDRLTKQLERNISHCRTLDELEYVNAPFKPVAKGTLAERAQAAGLEPFAVALLAGTGPQIRLADLVDRSGVAERSSVQRVEQSICHLLMHILSHHPVVLERAWELMGQYEVKIKTKKPKRVGKETEQAGTEEKELYALYQNFTSTTRTVAPHQTLALNRAERKKVLSVVLEFDRRVTSELQRYVERQFLATGKAYKTRTNLVVDAFADTCTKRLLPMMQRAVRAEMTRNAERVALVLFGRNLKQLLLTTPVKGERIMGIDPGCYHGCKLAVISESNKVLLTGTVYLHGTVQRREDGMMRLADLADKQEVSVIAIGNGQGCRDVEHALEDLYKQGSLCRKKVRYTIVPEQGASVYSCSETAQRELPDTRVQQMGAVTIARRLLDPLGEYSKTEPRHLGLGMYQHDVNEKLLAAQLADVVSECVSFVGVDLNTAPEGLLAHVAGLTTKKAARILEYRTNNGPFSSREQLLKVPSIGVKTYRQCAGFVYIDPATAGGLPCNPLDATWIHPESYENAERIMEELKLSPHEIGQPEFIRNIDCAIEVGIRLDYPPDQMKPLIAAMKEKLLYDYRTTAKCRPLFRTGMTQMSELSVGTELTGVISNVTDFGAFVDVGVGKHGLLHRTQYVGQELTVGAHVQVRVLSVDVIRDKLSLTLDRLLD